MPHLRPYMPNNTPSFDARYISSSDNIYRVYRQGSDLYFINLGGVSATAKAITVHFGLLGMLIQSMLKKRAKRQTDVLIQRLQTEDLESLLRENKTNFKIYVPEISEATIEPPSFFAMHGKQAGSWNFKMRDGKKFRFEFENNDTMKAALDLLPGLLTGTLRVNAEWNQTKKKYQKNKAPY